MDARNAPTIGHRAKLMTRPIQTEDAMSVVPTVTKRRACSKTVYLPDDPLLTAAEAAAERRQALSSFWRDVAAGRVPPAYYVSPRCPRWRRSELRAALEDCRSPAKSAS